MQRFLERRIPVEGLEIYIQHHAAKLGGVAVRKRSTDPFPSNHLHGETSNVEKLAVSGETAFSSRRSRVKYRRGP